MTTGITPVKPFEALAVDVEAGPDTVVIDSRVMGYTRYRVVPPSVVVTVVVVTDTETESTVVVASEDPPVADAPPIVTVSVIVACVARLLSRFSAFLIADSGIGAPATSQTSCSGVSNRLLSRVLSQLPCTQVMTSGRKFPADARQRQAISVTLQLSSWDCVIQSWTHCGREETNCACPSGSVKADSAKRLPKIFETIFGD